MVVALRKESVDRNRIVKPSYRTIFVALRKESVDRNCDLEPIRNAEAVALRKESVDRNLAYSWLSAWIAKSLSARRAWIEMETTGFAGLPLIGRSPQGERG